jgi:flagellar biosynthesis chaperone FliJ
VEAIQKRIADLENQHDLLKRTVETINSELEQERMLAAEKIDLTRYFPEFEKISRNRITKIEEVMYQLQEQIEQARLEMYEAFGELKKFEIARDLAEERLTKERQHQETLQMDELAITRQFQKDD